MELIISIIAVIISFVTFLYTVLVEYRVLSGYLARIEHFSLGVNTGIYDVKVTERAATSYLTMLYKKLEPLILTKNNSNNSSYENKYHKEFGKLVTALTKLEA